MSSLVNPIITPKLSMMQIAEYSHPPDRAHLPVPQEPERRSPPPAHADHGKTSVTRHAHFNRHMVGARGRGKGCARRECTQVKWIGSLPGAGAAPLRGRGPGRRRVPRGDTPRAPCTPPPQPPPTTPRAAGPGGSEAGAGSASGERGRRRSEARRTAEAGAGEKPGGRGGLRLLLLRRRRWRRPWRAVGWDVRRLWLAFAPRAWCSCSAAVKLGVDSWHHWMSATWAMDGRVIFLSVPRGTLCNCAFCMVPAAVQRDFF